MTTTHASHFRRWTISMLAVSLLGLPLAAQQTAIAEQQEATFRAGATWRDFRCEVGGEWLVRWCAATNTPKAIWGTGIRLPDWRENSLDEARRHAQQLLTTRSGLLGLGCSEFREVIGDRMGSTWVLVYDQYFHGLPVIGGRADVRINMAGRVPMFGSRAFGIDASFEVLPSISGETALAISVQTRGALQAIEPQMQIGPQMQNAPPRLVIWGDVDAPTPSQPVLAWEVPVDDVGSDGRTSIGRHYIDAKTGRALHYGNDKHSFVDATATTAASEAPDPPALPVWTTISFVGWTRTQQAANIIPSLVPLVGLEVNVPGIGIRTTDSNGQILVNLSTVIVLVTGGMDGRHHAPIAGTSAPSSVTVVAPGVPATVTLLAANASQAQLAHTTVAYWVERANEYCRPTLGYGNAQLNAMDSIQPTVNTFGSPCDSYYANNAITFGFATSACNATAFSTFIAHEWGHGLDDQYGGISNNPGDGLGEAWGDILAMYLVDDPRIGLGFQFPGIPVRIGLNTRQYTSLTPTTPPHLAGEVFMGFAWKLRERLAAILGRPAAITLTKNIVLGSIVADATDQAGAVLEVFIADDNDGDLLNGTPHMSELIATCALHSLPHPPAPSSASTSVFGNSCGGESRAFYELFDGPVDLSGLAMELVHNGNSYTVRTGGTYVPPTPSAATLALGDDSVTMVQLNGAFPYLGGTTTSLEVCANGFVSAAPGNATPAIGTLPSVTNLLGSAQARWGTWHDFNPPQGGQVTFEQIGSVAYVTWDNVAHFLQPSPPSTWQLQFDLNTGNVTYAWQSLGTISGTSVNERWIVGYASAAPNQDLGSLDLSTALPATFQAGANNRAALSLSSTTPNAGGNLMFTTTDYAPASPVGIQVLSLVQYNPGIDLSIAGMPGCRKFTGSEVTDVVLPVNGQSTYSLLIPSAGVFFGLAIHSQTYALLPGANAIGLVASNGVSAIVGL